MRKRFAPHSLWVRFATTSPGVWSKGLGEPRSRVIVVAGGTGEIGSAISRKLAAKDSSLVLGYLENRDRAEKLAKELAVHARHVELVPGNIADPLTRKKILEAIESLGGRCDALVHCVGVTSFKPLHDIRPNQWGLILEVSARSFLDLVVDLTGTLSNARGAVVALSSSGAARFVPHYGALGAAKAALEGIVRQLAVELAPRGIRVNAVRAGLVESDAARRLPEGTREAVIARTPLSRLGSAAEIAGAVSFLLGPESSWITGQSLEVDGGFGVA